MRQIFEIEKLEKIASEIRQDIIRMTSTAGSGHPGGALGLADILTAIYFNVLKHDPKHPDWAERDVFMLSNGHCNPVQYAAMARAGYFSVKELSTLRQLGSRLQGHPERTRLPGLETTSGPLGCGLSQAAGMALAMRMDGQEQKRRVYVILSDGEMQEGNTWEAAMLVGKYKPTNLVAIIDRNNIQIDGPTEEVMPLGDLREKWEAFGWYVLETDGNCIESIIDVCNMAKAIVEKPVVVIAHTTPGKGVDFMEHDYHWHGTAPSATQARKALAQLEEVATDD